MSWNILLIVFLFQWVEDIVNILWTRKLWLGCKNNNLNQYPFTIFLDASLIFPPLVNIEEHEWTINNTNIYTLQWVFRKEWQNIFLNKRKSLNNSFLHIFFLHGKLDRENTIMILNACNSDIYLIWRDALIQLCCC